MEYLLHILIMILIYTMLAQSLNLVAGFSGMVSLTQAGFYGIGAYTTAILSVNFGIPFLFTLLLAMLLSGLIAFVISIIVLRTVDDYFIIITLGIQVVLFSVMNNWTGVTRGPLGIPGIPAISIFGIEFDSNLSFLILSLFFAILIFYVIHNITSSPYGRVLRAMSEDEIFTRSLGKDVYKAKITSFVTGALFAAVPGALYAHYVSFIDPSSFTVNESIFILSIVIIGGMKNLWGSLIAAAFLIVLPELLRFIGLPDNMAANMKQMIYGAILILVMFRYSKHLVKKRQFVNNHRHT